MLKFNLKSQLQNWYDFFVLVLMLFFGAFYAYYEYRIILVLYPFFFIAFVQFSFTFYLHLTYYVKNKGEAFLIQHDRIERIKNRKTEIFFAEDIAKIVICKSANLDKWGIPYTTFECFRLARVYLKSGQVFILTNLLEHDIEKPLGVLRGVRFERRKGLSFFI